jgi:hypothetical protein
MLPATVVVCGRHMPATRHDLSKHEWSEDVVHIRLHHDCTQRLRRHGAVAAATLLTSHPLLLGHTSTASNPLPSCPSVIAPARAQAACRGRHASAALATGMLAPGMLELNIWPLRSACARLTFKSCMLHCA